MNLFPETPETPEQKLERVLRQTLRDLPARPAPRTLEHRVLAELERRAALPWWCKSYAYWPSPVRAVFFVFSAAAAAAVVAGLFALTRGGFAAGAVGDIALFQWLAAIRDTGALIIEKTGVILGAIPTLWLVAGGALLASCYATLIGVGAATYRLVRRRPLNF
jgi:hypothetical protein